MNQHLAPLSLTKPSRVWPLLESWITSIVIAAWLVTSLCWDEVQQNSWKGTMKSNMEASLVVVSVLLLLGNYEWRIIQQIAEQWCSSCQPGSGAPLQAEIISAPGFLCANHKQKSREQWTIFERWWNVIKLWRQKGTIVQIKMQCNAMLFNFKNKAAQVFKLPKNVDHWQISLVGHI